MQKRMLQVAANNNNIGSIFPTLLKSPDSKSMFPLDLSNMGPSQFLSAWLANNPINTAALNLAAQQTPSKVRYNSLMFWIQMYYILRIPSSLLILAIMTT